MCLIDLKGQLSEANTTIKQSEMELKPNLTRIKNMQGDSQKQDAAYVKDKKMLDNIENEVKKLQVNCCSYFFIFVVLYHYKIM